MHPVHAAFAHFVDYAGLFPPAGLDLQTTVRNHAGYAQSPEAWMLGRCVVPLARLPELARSLADGSMRRHAWTLAVLVAPADDLDEAAGTIGRFHADARTAGVTITAAEAVLPRPGAVRDFAGALSPTLERFVEIPIGAAPDAWLDAIADAGCRAKIRTGGLTADRFPPSESVAGLLEACASRNLPLKATAGLHHAIRGAYRLTYEPDSASGVMHGFLNLLVAALLLHTGAGARSDVERALETRDARAFAFDETALRWSGHSFGAGACQDARTHLLRSVGSCSFEEPLSELRTFGWWPALR